MGARWIGEVPGVNRMPLPSLAVKTDLKQQDGAETSGGRKKKQLLIFDLNRARAAERKVL